MASPFARAQHKLRKQWANDAQIVDCCMFHKLGELRGLVAAKGSLSRYKFHLASDTLSISPVLKAFSWQRKRPTKRPTTRNFTVD